MLTDAQLRSVRMLAEYIAVDGSASLPIRQCAERILQIIVPPVNAPTEVSKCETRQVSLSSKQAPFPCGSGFA